MKHLVSISEVSSSYQANQQHTDKIDSLLAYIQQAIGTPNELHWWHYRRKCGRHWWHYRKEGYHIACMCLANEKGQVLEIRMLIGGKLQWPVFNKLNPQKRYVVELEIADSVDCVYLVSKLINHFGLSYTHSFNNSVGLLFLASP
ncbi:hypothetical protein [Stenoxybacter acetivorans]|uniref:hypothetical protein n=1 Tax=Stenoxybacter acetivorans TaxID=422441 RepID=UPI00056A23B1|nr:hypothetical protein [Stenoxybacter acetivorans]